MSKKQLTNRLNALFAQLEETDVLPLSGKYEILPSWNWEVDAQGVYVTISPEVQDALGIPPEQWIGKSLFQFHIVPLFAGELQNLLQAGNFPFELDIYHLNATNQQVLTRVMVFSASTESGNPGWRGFTQMVLQEPMANPKSDLASEPITRQIRSDLNLVPPLAPSTRISLSLEEITNRGSRFWTEAGKLSQSSKKAVAKKGSSTNPSAMAVPVDIGEEDLAVLEIVDDNGERAWSENDQMLVEEISRQLTMALEKQHLLSEAQKRAIELQTAAEIARDTTSTLSTNLLLDRMVNLIRDRLGYYHVSIFLLDSTNNFAVVQESTGEAGRVLKERNHKLAVGSRSVIGSATSSGNTVCLNDVSQSPLFYPNPLLPETRSETGIPLKFGDRIIGALDLQSNKVNAFTPDDLTVLQILGDQIAVAIENARAFELSQQAYEDMKEVDRLKSQFLANMSHELRTPLNSIIGFSRVILKGIDGPINDTQKQDLSAIYNSGQHLLTLINNILDLSKIEAGKMELQFSDINMADLINSVMSTAVGLVKDRPIKLHQVVPEEFPIVQADPTRVRQVLLNFVSNATKFTEEGSITVEASLTVSPEGKDEVMVTITDSGAGIAPEDQYKLFQPFSQVDDSPTRKTGGTGLGLSICRSFIEMHNGRIGLLRSEVNKGSTFFFTLPLPEPEPSVDESHETNIILSIDDDPQVISLYQRYLRPQGFRVIPVTNPKEAVEKARQLKPYAITLDIMMPDVDGWSVMQALKSDPQTRDIPIVVCSILEEEEKGFSLGAADYLVKPFLQEDLSNAVNRLNIDGKIHTILVIDDDPEDLRLVQKMLDKKPFEVRTAEGGKAGWEALQTNAPDAVILDLFMPDLNGFTLLEHLRTDEKLKNLPVIILTGADLSPEELLQINSFGQSMLTKGVLRESELLNTLEHSLKTIRNKVKST